MDSLPIELSGKPKNTGVGSLYPFSRGSSQPRNWTGVSCIAGGFFTSWAIREADKYTSKFFLNKVDSELYYIALEKEKNRLFKIGGKKLNLLKMENKD